MAVLQYHSESVFETGESENGTGNALSSWRFPIGRRFWPGLHGLNATFMDEDDSDSLTVQ